MRTREGAAEGVLAGRSQMGRQALIALEDPAGGMLLDDFNLRCRERERKRDNDDARWFYRDKTSPGSSPTSR